MADVFISYHDKTNGDRAEEIAATLEKAGITCWYAKRDISPGDDFTHEVITQIENCKVFFLLLDNAAARSPHVETEVGNAFGRRKKIMPYQIDTQDVKNVSWVQYYLKHTQIVPLPDYDTLTEQIATALGLPVKTVTPELQAVEVKPEMLASEPIQIVPLPDYDERTKELVRALEQSVRAAMPKPQSSEPEPETVPLMAQVVEPEPEPQETIEILLSAFTLIFVIIGGIFGFFWGYDTSFNWFLTITLDDFFKGVLGAFTGYYVGWLVSYIILFIIAKRTDNPDILLGADDLDDSSRPTVVIILIWYLIGVILGGIIGYRISGGTGAVFGGMIAIFLFVVPLLPLRLKETL